MRNIVEHDLTAIPNCEMCAKAETWTEYGHEMHDCTAFDQLTPDDQEEYLNSCCGQFAIKCRLFVAYNPREYD